MSNPDQVPNPENITFGLASKSYTYSAGITTEIIQEMSNVPNPSELLAPLFRITAADTKVKHIVPNVTNIVTVKSTHSVADAFKILIDNNILSAPLLDVTVNNYIYFLHLLDILAYLVDVYQYQTSNTVAPRLEEVIMQDRFKHTPVTAVIQRSLRNPWYTISEQSSLQEAIDLLFRTRADQLAVANVEGIFSSILTQYGLVEWLSSRPVEEIGRLGEKTIDTFKLGFRGVVRINYKRIALEAFLRMDAVGVSGVAVTDDFDRIIGNISATDLGDIGPGAENFRKLYMDCGSFLDQKTRSTDIPKLVAVNRNSTVNEVLEKFGQHHIHRVYIVEEDSNLPVGVISDGDIIALFATAIPVVAQTTQSRV